MQYSIRASIAQPFRYDNLRRNDYNIKRFIVPIVKPLTTFWGSDDFGIPKGTPGRNSQVPVGIILHSFRRELDAGDSQVKASEYRPYAHSRHSSVHYLIGYAGDIHQYILDTDIAWGTDDYNFTSQPNPPPIGSPYWALQSSYPGIPPDTYSFNVAITSGLDKDNPEIQDPFSYATRISLIKLLCYLCNAYNIPIDAAHIVTHNQVDGSMVGDCVESYFPLADVIAETLAYCQSGGDPLIPPVDLCLLGQTIPEGTLTKVVGVDADGCLVKGAGGGSGTIDLCVLGNSIPDGTIANHIILGLDSDGCIVKESDCQQLADVPHGKVRVEWDGEGDPCEYDLSGNDGAPYVAHAVYQNAVSNPDGAAWHHDYFKIIHVGSGGNADYAKLSDALAAIGTSGSPSNANRWLIHLVGVIDETATSDNIGILYQGIDVFWEANAQLKLGGNDLYVNEAGNLLAAATINPNVPHILKTSASSGKSTALYLLADTTLINLVVFNLATQNIDYCYGILSQAVMYARNVIGRGGGTTANTNCDGIALTTGADNSTLTDCEGYGGNGQGAGIGIGNITATTLVRCIARGSTASNSPAFSINGTNIELIDCDGRGDGEFASSPADNHGLLITQNGLRATRCKFSGGYGVSHGVWVGSQAGVSDVHFTDCNFLSGHSTGSAGLRVSNASIEVRHCELLGRDGAACYGAINNGFMRAYQCSFIGADVGGTTSNAYALEQLHIEDFSTIFPLPNSHYINCSFKSNLNSNTIQLASGAAGDTPRFYGGVASCGNYGDTRSKAFNSVDSYTSAPVMNMVLDGGATNLTPLSGTALGSNTTL